MTKLQVVPNVNFNVSNKGGEQILISKSIDTVQRKDFFGRPRHFKYTYNRIWIEYQIPESIVIPETSRSEIFKIQFTGIHAHIQPANLIENILIKNTPSVPYNVIFNPDAIADCEDLDLSCCKIAFDLKGQKEKGGEIVTHSYSFDIALYKAVATLSRKIEYEYSTGDGFEYRNNSKQLIGRLRVENDCPYRFATVLDLSASLRFNQAFNEDIISWGSNSEICESNPYDNVRPGIRNINESLQSCLEIHKDKDTIVLRKIVSKNIITIPIYCDFTRIGNPTSKNRKCEFSISFMNLNDGNIKSEKHHFLLLQDTRCTQIKTLLKIGSRVINLSDNKSVYAGKYKWKQADDSTGERFAGRTNLFSLIIGNQAECVDHYQDAAVHISGMSLKMSYIKQDNVNNVILGANVNNLESIIRKNGEFDPFMSFGNAPDSYVESEFYFQHQAIEEIVNNVAHVKIEVSFDYWEDSQGLYVKDKNRFNENKQPIVFSVDFYLEKDPGAEWLCVDFGTSATVAAFGNGSEKTALVNLQRRYIEVLDNNVPANFRTPRFEENTDFLSSNLIFNDHANANGGLEPAPFKRNIIWLSPSESQFNNAHHAILPYIKALVGHRRLPNESQYRNISYYNSQGQVVNFGAHPLSVDDIFVSVYKSLFVDYVLPAIGEKNVSKANKLIITIPNTYTPRHVDYMKSIINNNFKFVRENYIRFISESDAVACYYLSYWQDLNRNRDKAVREQLNLEAEYVLVYDMGAGTLDLTYLVIRRIDATNRSVDILAKIGGSKAGNFLDYVIAKAVVETCELPDVLLAPINAATSLQARALKAFVRDKIKPKMYLENTIEYTGNSGGGVGVNFVVDCEKLRSHEEIVGFVDSCTDELLRNFFVLNGYTEGITHLNTVIFTGRSVQFGDIKEKVIKGLQKWNGGQTIFSIDGKGSEESSIEKGNNLKSIVVDGALQFAALYGREGSIVKINNKNIYAAYGLLYKDVTGNWSYKELISPSTRPVKIPENDVYPVDGISVYEYDSDIYCADGSERHAQVVNLSNSPIAYFVQNFSTDPVTDWRADHKEYISEMFSFSPVGVVANPIDVAAVHVRIQVNEKNEMIFTAGSIQNDPRDPLVIAVAANDVFKQSMWPYL